MKHEDKIVKILKQYEGKNSHSISSDKYYEIATKIYNELIKPQVIAKQSLKIKLDNAIIKYQDIRDAGY